MHYRSGLNAIPLIEWYRRHPDDLETLRIAVGAQSGQLTNIDDTGAPSIYFHDFPHVMDHDAYSGDYGLGFFGVSLEASATFVVDATLGPLCFLCDWKEAAARYVTPRDVPPTRLPRTARLYLQADAGTFTAVDLDLGARTVRSTSAAAASRRAR